MRWARKTLTASVFMTSTIMTRVFISTAHSGVLIRATPITRPWNRRGSERATIARGAASGCLPKRNGKRRHAAPTAENIRGATPRQTARAAGFAAGASPYGVLGMAGNTWEWVSSAYRSYPYRPTDGREDLQAGP